MNIEQAFWSQIDPFYHLKQASCIRYARDIDQHFRLDDQAGGETDFGAELVEGLDEMRGSSLRFIRFHAVETLLTVFLGSHPHGPVPRFAHKFRATDLNNIVESIARREIPKPLHIDGVKDYDTWMTTKFWGRKTTENILSDEIISFFGVQAALFNQKTAYNAFKHGCRIGRSWPKLSFQDEKSGEWVPLLEITSGVGWLNWEEGKKATKASVSFGAMECDPADDHGAVAIMALLVRAMKVIRLATPGDRINIQLPNNLKAGMRAPASLNFRMTLAAS